MPDMSLAKALARDDQPWHVQRTIAVAPPAAGAEVSVTVPGGSLWSVKSVFLTLTTSAAVANRRPVLRYADGLVTFCDIASANVQAAGVTETYTWAAGVGAASINAPTNGNFAPAFDEWLLPGATIKTVTALIDVADQYSAIALYVEEVLLQPLGVYQQQRDAQLLELLSSSPYLRGE